MTMRTIARRFFLFGIGLLLSGVVIACGEMPTGADEAEASGPAAMPLPPVSFDDPDPTGKDSPAYTPPPFGSEADTPVWSTPAPNAVFDGVVVQGGDTLAVITPFEASSHYSVVGIGYDGLPMRYYTSLTFSALLGNGSGRSATLSIDSDFLTRGRFDHSNCISEELGEGRAITRCEGFEFNYVDPSLTAADEFYILSQRAEETTGRMSITRATPDIIEGRFKAHLRLENLFTAKPVGGRMVYVDVTFRIPVPQDPGSGEEG